MPAESTWSHEPLLLTTRRDDVTQHMWNASERGRWYGSMHFEEYLLRSSFLSRRGRARSHSIDISNRQQLSIDSQYECCQQLENLKHAYRSSSAGSSDEIVRLVVDHKNMTSPPMTSADDEVAPRRDSISPRGASNKVSLISRPYANDSFEHNHNTCVDACGLESCLFKLM